MHPLNEHLEKITAARELYIKYEKELWALPKSQENRNRRTASQAIKLELFGASNIPLDFVSGLEQEENLLKRAIGQFRQGAENFRENSQEPNRR